MAVVGAGMSGLVCSVELGRAGLDVQVIEAADAVGGRVRTDLGGFRLDRGFQVLSTGYPQAQALIATSLVHRTWEGDAGEPAVRERLATLYRTSTAAWDHVATYDIPRALPAMSAPHEFRKPVRHGKAYVCGDHRDTSSIQGAMVSGRRAASAVLADLAAGAR